VAKVLFPDPFIITEVAAVRALGRRGDTCDVAWPYGPIKKLFKSRFIGQVKATSNIAHDPDQFARDVIGLCKSGEYDVVLPVSLASTEALLPFQKELSRHTATLLPTMDQLQIGADKLRTLQICKDLGIAHPETWIISDERELDRVAALVTYPVVIKVAQNLGGSRGVRFAGDTEELSKAYSDLQGISSANSALLVQEHIPGLLFDAVAVARDGYCPRIHTSARKLMYPISGGVTCISVSSHTPKLKKLAAMILAELKWTGPVELEFKLDSRDGQFKLIEINPRFWASLGASIKCGVNFPGIAVDLAMGREVTCNHEHDAGVRHKFMIGRVPYAYWQLARARGCSAIRDPQIYHRTTYDIDLLDPMPDVFDCLLLSRSLLTGKFPKPLTEGGRQMIEGLENPVPYE